MIFIVYASTHAGSAEAKMGLADYSYHFVLESFRPVLERLGTVVQVLDAPEVKVDAIFDIATSRGESCLFLSFTPPHKTLIHLRCPTVPVFAWEYHDLPRRVDQSLNDDWCFVLRSLGSAITHSEACAELVRGALGEDFPIAVIKAPLFDAFARPADDPPPSPHLERQVFEIHGHVEEAPRVGGAPARPVGHAPLHDGDRGTNAHEWRPQSARYLLEIEGIVYLSIFNPGDGRKNWREMVRCFALALGERPDVTLVLKTIQRGAYPANPNALRETLRPIGPLRCRILLLHGYLDDETYRRLIQSATYGLNASRGEGQCLPLMETLSAGRPAVAPPHTGMADYLDASNAFCVDSSLEPTIIPHDPSGKWLTWQHRIDAHSLYGACLESYRVAQEEPARYRRMAEGARANLEGHASRHTCGAALRTFLARRQSAGVVKASARDTRADIDRAFRRQLLRLRWSNHQRSQWQPAPDRATGPVHGVPLHFILAGFAKCGTTSLTVLLDSHPDLFIRREENWHFAPGTERSDDDFKRFFTKALPGQRLGICGVTYSSARDEAIARDAILGHYPDVKLLFVARDPLARLESAYREYHHSWHRTAAGLPPFDVSATLEKNPTLVEDCRYGARLSSYAAHMPPENIHVLFFEELFRDPAATLRECYTFLGVDASVPVPSAIPRLNVRDDKLRDTEELRMMLNPQTAPHLAKALRVLSLEERDPLALSFGLREPHPAELPGWDETSQRRFVRSLEPDIRSFLATTGRRLDLWPRFAAYCSGEEGGDGRDEQGR